MTENRKSRLTKLQQSMGYSFKSIQLLETALTHSSYSKGDGNGNEHYERLEYLGDAVLELIVSEALFNSHKNWPEGELTRARSKVVRENTLYEIAKDKLSLPQYLLLGHGEERSGGRDKPSIISDAMEAVIGAVYVDGGFESARELVFFVLGDIIRQVKGTTRDYKTTLQEYAQQKRMGNVSYRLKATSGPEHRKVFVMQALINGSVAGEGKGQSKQEASQSAAGVAIKKLSNTKER